MKRPFPSARSSALLLAFLLASPARTQELPGLRLLARLEANLASHRQELERTPAHDALVFELGQPELLGFMRQIQFHRDGSDFVLGVAYGPESHGGGLLALLLDAWRPSGRTARLGDAFHFEANGRALELAEIYRSHQRQIFLPVPGREAESIDGALPTTPQLPRMRFRYPTEARPVETDAYKFLGLLLAHERDPSATWKNHLGQVLSVDRLLRNARGHYLARRGSELEVVDHSNLHLVELLLAYDRRRPDPTAADEIKRRFLEVELKRERFEGEDGSEALAHYVESLGVLLAEAHVSWQPDEKQQVRAWLRALERDRFGDLDAVRLQHQAHLLRGLRLVAANRDRLSSGATDQ